MPSIINRADLKPIGGKGTSGEAFAVNSIVYLKNDGKWWKADNTLVRNTNRLAIAKTAASAADEAFLYISGGKASLLIAGTVAIGDRLTPSSTAGKAVKGTTLAHTHTLTVGTEAYPSGVTLNFNTSGASGSKFVCTAGGTETTSSTTPGDRLFATAAEAGVDGDTIEVWVGAL
jgi:hypothetical protein|tara:strand:+ start:3329 stop:3850 length:522 start_codon:yes stop_codon:yes gene_type:complete